MMDNKASMALSNAQSNYTDLSGLNDIRKLGAQDQDAALEKIAKQFESILMHNMLKSMRQANAVFEKDSMFNSSEMNFHRDMLDHQLSLSLSEGRGIGLADALVRQLKNSYGTAERGTANSDALGDLKKTVKHSVRTDSVPEKLEEAPSLDDPAAFIRHILPHAKQAAEAIGVDPGVLISQAALETGWGKHVIHDSRGSSSFNLFNIKADNRWDGDSVQVKTLEYRDGLPKPEVAAFRRYDSYGQSFADYVEFIKSNPRYQDALQQAASPDGYLKGLQDAGYATDPQYAKKISNIFKSDLLNIASR